MTAVTPSSDGSLGRVSYISDLRPLGRTGLHVSPLTLGTMEFGSKVEVTEAERIFAAAIDAGVNMVDTANVYAGGRSEEIVGQLIALKRDRLLLATKFSVETDTGIRTPAGPPGVPRSRPARRACDG